MVGEVTFAVLGVLFLIADIRTFGSTFQLTFYGQPNSTLVIMATATFATAFLAPLLGWRLGPRRSVAVSGAILGLATLFATLSRSNVPDLALSIVGLAAGLWWLGLLHASRPADRQSPLPIAIPIAFAVDLALRAAFHSVPVVDVTPTVSAPLALVAALLFFASGVAALGAQRSWTRPGLRGAIALLALPALFLVAETGGTNGAQIALAGGLGLGPEPARSTELGMVLAALGLASGALVLSRPIARGGVAALLRAPGAAPGGSAPAPARSLARGLPSHPDTRRHRGASQHVPGHDLQHPSGLQLRAVTVPRSDRGRDRARIA